LAQRGWKGEARREIGRMSEGKAGANGNAAGCVLTIKPVNMIAT